MGVDENCSVDGNDSRTCCMRRVIMNKIPCYVTGKGMYASDPTWQFKTAVIELLERTGLGFDTRFRYYQEKFPDRQQSDLARLVCDPVEYYDPDWPLYWASKKGEGREKERVVTEFMLELDARFQRQAKVAIFCFDEAGFGSGVNVMRFIQSGKPILGLYNPAIRKRDVNFSNVLQLQIEFPFLFTLQQYDTIDALCSHIQTWLQHYSAPGI